MCHDIYSNVISLNLIIVKSATKQILKSLLSCDNLTREYSEANVLDMLKSFTDTESL